LADFGLVGFIPMWGIKSGFDVILAVGPFNQCHEFINKYRSIVTRSVWHMLR